ncbi:MAG: lipopolysaccharide kinase InaA family protein [Pseudomonadales bacterium]|jgi:tRNA A-37 threonylcarbamoyl transferase component Bud32
MQHINLQHFLDLELEYFEPVNIRRGGWSGVARVEFADQAYFIKRQVNHTYRNPSRFFLKSPTLRREYNNFLKLKNLSIGTPEIILYAEDGADAMMVTRELTGFIDLNTYLSRVTATEPRRQVFTCLTEIILRIHSNNLHHGCLYGKHVMVDEAKPTNIALIDLEKMKFAPRKRYNACKDVSQLIRQTQGMFDSERNQILSAYESKFPGFRTDLEKDLKKKSYRHTPS